MFLPTKALFVAALVASSFAWSDTYMDDLEERELALDAWEAFLDARDFELDYMDPSLEQRALGDRVRCRNSVNGNFIIKKKDASSAIHYAPITPRGRKTTGSGYPHEFQNIHSPIVWPNSKCNKLPSGHYLLEFPVFANGRLYNYRKKPKDDPGMARAIFSVPSKDLCGIIAHEGDARTRNPNLGALRLCPNA